MTGWWGPVGILGALLLWATLCALYSRALRRIFLARVQSLTRALDQYTDSVRVWQARFEEVRRRDWREEALGVDRTLEVMMGNTALGEKIETARQIRSLLEGERRRVSEEPTAFAAEIQRLAARLELAWSHLDTSLAEYEIVRGDVAFACGRFPLSVIAALVGLRAEGPAIHTGGAAEAGA